MKRLAFIPLWIIPLLACSQGNTYIGLNFSPLIVNALDVRFESQLSPNFSLQLSSGFRYQNRDNGEPPGTGLLQGYSGLRNLGLHLAVGGRFFNRTEWEYPYIAFDVIGAYYKEKIVPLNTTPPAPQSRNVSGLKLGGSLTIGFMIKVAERFYLDLGMQMGYSPPRPKSDVLAYYLPGMGYSTFGFGRVGVDGGHFQPIIGLKYVLSRDKRERIREMD